MEAYVARQPIFDRELNIYGYELLYRRSTNNFFEGLSDGQATADLITNAFLVMQFDELTNKTRAFINFSQDLLEQEIPFVLPQRTTVIEILERVKVTQSVIDSCKQLKENGYILALDDFVFDDSFLPLIEMADIIKVEFSEMPFSNQRKLIKKYKKKGIKFLAEKVETREDFNKAYEMGYDFFQGFFFSKPVIVSGKKIESLNTSLIMIIEELSQEDPSYQKITEIIEKDLGLSYKLLRLANSVFFGTKHKIYSIKQALVRLGTEEMKRWVYVMMLREIQNRENKELIKNSMIRGKLMELLALEMNIRNKHFEFFMTGIFSSIDDLLNRSMKEIVNELPLTSEVKDALLKKNDNPLKLTLDQIRMLEKANWDQMNNAGLLKKLSKKRFTEIYISAIKWFDEMEEA